MSRRTLLGALGGSVGVGAGILGLRSVSQAGENTASSGKTFPVTLTDDQWRAKLTPAQYKVLRDHGTERAGTSPLNGEKRKGIFHCAGCDSPLFDSGTKYESGTGWPSFWEPLPNAVGTKEDRSFFMVRTEVHCATCGGHLGHVFDDGPPPTRLRYCMNGVAMTFKPAEA